MWRKTDESASSPSLSSVPYPNKRQTTVRLALRDDRGLHVSESSIVGAFAGILYSIHNQNYANEFITQLQTSDSGTLHNKLMSADVRQIFYTYCSEFGAGNSKLQVIYRSIQYCVLQFACKLTDKKLHTEHASKTCTERNQRQISSLTSKRSSCKTSISMISVQCNGCYTSYPIHQFLHPQNN